MTTYFITICAHMQQNLFQRDEIAELMLATFFKYRDAGEFKKSTVDANLKVRSTEQLLIAGFRHV